MISQPHSGLWRVPCVRSCYVEGKGGTQGAVLCNISVEGAYINLLPIPPVGERVRLRFQLPGSEVPIFVEAEVCWENSAQRHQVHSLPPGCGVRFLALSRPDRERVERLVKAYVEPGPQRRRRL